MKANQQVPINPMYSKLRERALQLLPGEVGLAPTPALPQVYGLLMETAYREAVVTLAVFAEGTTSLYFSSGGGILGAGEDHAVAQASQALLSTAETCLSRLQPVQDIPLPNPGMVRFTVLTYTGPRTAEVLEEALYTGQHPLVNLGVDAQAVITRIRLLQEAPAA